MSRVTMGLDCGAICEGGECDLQGDHGGNMHSGLIEGARVWWDRDGKLVDFSKPRAGGS